MLFEMFCILLILMVLLFFVICFFMFVEQSTTKPVGLEEEHIGNYRMALPLIMVNIILCILLTYGSYYLEWMTFTSYDIATSNYTSNLSGFQTFDYNVWVTVFSSFVFIHVLLFFKNVFDILREGTFDRGKKNYR